MNIRRPFLQYRQLLSKGKSFVDQFKPLKHFSVISEQQYCLKRLQPYQCNLQQYALTMSSSTGTSELRSRTSGANEIDLGEVVKRIEAKAPTYLAESWDNVGVLVEPSSPHKVSKLLLTNDFTEQVLEEAIKEKADLLFSYHPPIFVPLKRLTQKSVKERIIVKCIENRIAVYSPHTVYDALEDGVNNWLAGAFETKGITNKRPVSRKQSNSHFCHGSHRLEVTVDSQYAENIQEELLKLCNAASQMSTKSVDGSTVRLSYNVTEDMLTTVVRYLMKNGGDSVSDTEVFQLHKPPHPGAGIGLVFDVEQPVPLEEAVSHVKQHVGLQHLRLSLGNGCTTDSLIKTVACCAGSGSSVLGGTRADLYLTGEMSHHDLLDATSKGVSVILCEHSNSERGFLKTLLERFTDVFSDTKMEIVVSCMDQDPVTIV